MRPRSLRDSFPRVTEEQRKRCQAAVGLYIIAALAQTAAPLLAWQDLSGPGGLSRLSGKMH